MRSLSKIDLILNFRRHHTLKETGERFKLTSERIRQIQLTKHRKTCKEHNRFYYNSCSYCLAKNYEQFLMQLDYAALEKEVVKESKNKLRDYLSVQRRAYLIEILFVKFQKSWTEIALMLNKDRSTIIHLYNKYVKRN